MKPSSTGAEARVATRPVAAADEPVVFAAFASTREEELARVPWTPEQKNLFLRSQFEAQTREYAARNPGSQHLLVLVDGQPAGRLWTILREGELRIIDLTILPALRGAGHGGVLVARLQREAREAGVPLTIWIESYARSRGLFERMGFRPVEERGFHLLHAWDPRLTPRGD